MKINHTELSTKERLFKAAIRVFAEKGYEAATVRDICHRADANVAAINYHYGDKEKLYFQVVRQIFKSTHESRTPYLGPDAPPYERLRTYIRASFEELLPSTNPGKDTEECLAMGTIFMLEMARPTGALDSIVKDYIAPDSDEINDIVAAILGEDAPPEMVGMSAASVIAQPLHFYYSMPIIKRLNPEGDAFLTDPGFIDYATEHVFQFCEGGLEHFKKNLRGK